jgi:hypothetical protein
MNAFPIEIGSLTDFGSKSVFQDWVVYNSHDWFPVDVETDGNSSQGKRMDKIHGSINWVDNPGGGISDYIFLRFVSGFFTDEFVIWKRLSESPNNEFLHSFVCLSHKVHVGAFGSNILLLVKSFLDNLHLGKKEI